MSREWTSRRNEGRMGQSKRNYSKSGGKDTRSMTKYDGHITVEGAKERRGRSVTHGKVCKKKEKKRRKKCKT